MVRDSGRRKPDGELQNVIIRAKDFGGFGFHSVVIGTSGSGKSEFFLSWCNGIALTHSPETFIVIFVDMKFESAAQDILGIPHVVAVAVEPRQGRPAPRRTDA